MDAIKLAFSKWVSFVADGLNHLPFAGTATANMQAFASSLESGAQSAADFTSKMVALREERNKNIALNDTVLGGMFAAVDAAPSAGKKNKVNKSPGNNGEDEQGKKIAQAQEEARKIIDIHSFKFARMNAMGAVAFASEQEKLQAGLKLKLQTLDAEQARIEEAAITQGANVENIRAYYDEQRISAAQSVADQLGAIDQQRIDDARARKEQEDADRLQLLTDGEQAAYDLKAQFQQLTSDNQQVNLDAMAKNIASFAKTSAAWDKFTGQQKLQFASASLGALSGLMKSHNRKQFEVGKAAAQGENAINTYLGATKAFQAMSGIPYVGPVLGAIAAAAVVAAGMANAQKINSAKMGGNTGGVAVPTMSAGGAGATPSVGMNTATGIPQSQQQTQQAPQINITVQALHPDAISPDTVQMIADGFAPALHDSFGRGQHLAVQAA